MPFGLCNAAQTLLRLQDNLFQNLLFVFVYLDDGHVASRNQDEHVDHLQAVFRILEDNGLAINLDKCEFAVPELDFLGHGLSAAGVTPLWDSLQVMLDFPRPHTVKDLQRFLGTVNFYRCFLPKIAQTLPPLLKGYDLPNCSLGRSIMTLPSQLPRPPSQRRVPLAHPLPDVPLASTACWRGAATSSGSRWETGLIRSPPAASSPAWTLLLPQQPRRVEDVPRASGGTSPSAGHP
jgi:Reverse transcriptase (RNA-dependent DNA polymerase)